MRLLALLLAPVLALALGCGEAAPPPPPGGSGSGSGSPAGSDGSGSGSNTAPGSGSGSGVPFFALRIRESAEAPGQPKRPARERTVYFHDRFAFDHDRGGKPSVVFDVVAGAWQEPGAPAWVPLGQARQLVEASRKKALEQLKGKPPGPFRALLEARLDVTFEGATLQLTNQFVRIHALVREAPTEQLVRVLAWDQLNAYRQAGIRRVPPFVNLRLNVELGRARRLLRRVEISLAAPGGWQRSISELTVVQLEGAERTAALATAARLKPAGR